MPRQSTDLPFGDAFSPGSLRFSEDGPCKLPLILELVEKHEGDKESFTEEIADLFYKDSSQPLGTAKNVALGMNTRSGYGLVDDNFGFTEIGRELYRLRDNEEAMYERFAERILLHLHGLKVLDIINDLQMTGESTTVTNIIPVVSSFAEARGEYGGK